MNDDGVVTGSVGNRRTSSYLKLFILPEQRVKELVLSLPPDKAPYIILKRHRGSDLLSNDFIVSSISSLLSCQMHVLELLPFLHPPH